MSPNTQGIYVHIPWCRRRCPYCAFYVEVDRLTPWDAWRDGVLRDWEELAPSYPHNTVSVFLGGGTPSRAPPAVLQTLLAALPRTPNAEVTAETNPEDADAAWIDGALEAGINRLSLGLQTFNPQFARLLNRACSIDDARDTARRVGRAGFNSWSVDLIFALPGQTLSDLKTDLQAILDVEPPHVSLYGLTFEPGTPFERARERGKLTPVEDDLWREMYDLIVDTLEAAGLHRYEVSNFARPGHRSVHNQLYWSDRPYAGLGPSAHGYTHDGRRFTNVSDVAAWMKGSTPREWERLSASERATDLLVSGLRGVEGITDAHLAATTGATIHAPVRSALASGGLISSDPGVLKLAFGGFPLADAVIARLVDSLRFEEAGSPTIR